MRFTHIARHKQQINNRNIIHFIFHPARQWYKIYTIHQLPLFNVFVLRSTKGITLFLQRLTICVWTHLNINIETIRIFWSCAYMYSLHIETIVQCASVSEYTRKKITISFLHLRLYSFNCNTYTHKIIFRLIFSNYGENLLDNDFSIKFSSKHFLHFEFFFKFIMVLFLKRLNQSFYSH